MRFLDMHGVPVRPAEFPRLDPPNPLLQLDEYSSQTDALGTTRHNVTISPATVYINVEKLLLKHHVVIPSLDLRLQLRIAQVDTVGDRKIYRCDATPVKVHMTQEVPAEIAPFPDLVAAWQAIHGGKEAPMPDDVARVWRGSFSEQYAPGKMLKLSADKRRCLVSADMWLAVGTETDASGRWRDAYAACQRLPQTIIECAKVRSAKAARSQDLSSASGVMTMSSGDVSVSDTSAAATDATVTELQWRDSRSLTPSQRIEVGDVVRCDKKFDDGPGWGPGMDQWLGKDMVVEKFSVTDPEWARIHGFSWPTDKLTLVRKKCEVASQSTAPQLSTAAYTPRPGDVVKTSDDKLWTVISYSGDVAKLFLAGNRRDAKASEISFVRNVELRKGLPSADDVAKSLHWLRITDGVPGRLRFYSKNGKVTGYDYFPWGCPDDGHTITERMRTNTASLMVAATAATDVESAKPVPTEGCEFRESPVKSGRLDLIEAHRRLHGGRWEFETDDSRHHLQVHKNRVHFSYGHEPPEDINAWCESTNTESGMVETYHQRPVLADGTPVAWDVLERAKVVNVGDTIVPMREFSLEKDDGVNWNPAMKALIGKEIKVKEIRGNSVCVDRKDVSYMVWTWPKHCVRVVSSPTPQSTTAKPSLDKSEYTHSVSVRMPGDGTVVIGKVVSVEADGSAKIDTTRADTKCPVSNPDCVSHKKGEIRDTSGVILGHTLGACTYSVDKVFGISDASITETATTKELVTMPEMKPTATATAQPTLIDEFKEDAVEVGYRLGASETVELARDVLVDFLTAEIPDREQSLAKEYAREMLSSKAGLALVGLAASFGLPMVAKIVDRENDPRVKKLARECRREGAMPGLKLLTGKLRELAGGAVKRMLGIFDKLPDGGAETASPPRAQLSGSSGEVSRMVVDVQMSGERVTAKA